MTRSELRENVFRVLFRYDFHELEDFEQQVELFLSEYPQEEDLETEEEITEATTNQDVEHWPNMSKKNREQVLARTKDIQARISDIDQVISDKITGWTIERVGKAELSILRLATFEILFDEDIDAAIAIDEAVNLAKKYCDDKSPSFVNGVLAKIAR